MKIKNFSHNDLDGIGSTILYKVFFGMKNVSANNLAIRDVEPTILDFINSKLTYNKKSPSGEIEEIVDYMHDYDEIHITDISVGEELAKRLDEIHHSEDLPLIRLIDHHKTAEWLNKYEWATVDVERNSVKTSGTSIVIEELELDKYKDASEVNELTLSKLQHFAETVRQYDTWDWFNVTNNILAKEMNDYLYMIGGKQFSEEVIGFIKNDGINKPTYFTKSARDLIDFNQKEIDFYIKKKDKQLIVKDGVGHLFADQHVSELGNVTCINHPEIDYVMIYDMGKMSVSLRAVKEEIDVSEIAKKLGGGGHSKAAGAPLPESIVDNHIKLIQELL